MAERITRKIKRPLFSNFCLDETNENVYLWRAVLDQALDDYIHRDKLKPKQKREIIEWVNIDNKDFQEVCELANFDHRKVFKVFQK